MVSADGKSGQVPFDKGGTGEIERPIRKSIKWAVEGDAFCIRMGFMLGTKCFQTIKTATGYQGYSRGKASVSFSR